MNEIFNCDLIDCDMVSIHLPKVIESLYYSNITDLYDLIEFRDALRLQQLQSKSWLLQHLDKLDRNSKILVVGSWIGFISYCIQKMGFIDVSETDMDPKHQKISQRLNSQFSNFQHYNSDVNLLNLSYFDVIICTSCEHISDISWYSKVKNGTKLFLQSNNLIHEQHTKIVQSVEEFITHYPNIKLKYIGTMIYNELFSRYMIIGEKE
jgi:hypothetical protein